MTTTWFMAHRALLVAVGFVLAVVASVAITLVVARATAATTTSSVPRLQHVVDECYESSPGMPC